MAERSNTGIEERSAPPIPLHAGHRERLRERARIGGLAAVPDYELLELFLFRSIPQRDVKPLAKALLSRFGSLSATLSADDEALKQVSALDSRGRKLKIGPETALDLNLLQEACLRVGRETVKQRPVISSWTALLAYVRVALAHEPREQFRVLFLDRKCARHETLLGLAA
jgi:DNA repair protein RadC